MKVTVIPIVVGALGMIHKKIGERTGRLRNQKTCRDHLDYSIIKIGQKTEKSPGDLKKICCHSNSSEKPSAYAGVKNSQRSKIIIIYDCLKNSRNTIFTDYFKV